MFWILLYCGVGGFIKLLSSIDDVSLIGRFSKTFLLLSRVLGAFTFLELFFESLDFDLSILLLFDFDLDLLFDFM